MTFLSFDTLRALALVPAALTFPLAIAILVVSGKVLKPLPNTWREWWGTGAGFQWLHIWAVALPTQASIVWMMVEVIIRLGEPSTWRTGALWLISSVWVVGYLIIYRIELARLRFIRDGLAP